MTNLITGARELCEAATPGPWYVHESHNWHKDPPKEYFVITRGAKEIVASWVETSNAQFIARSRTLIPELCDALENTEKQLQEQFDKTGAWLEEYNEMKIALENANAEIERLREAQRWRELEEEPCGDIGQKALLYGIGGVDEGEYLGEGDWKVEYGVVPGETFTHWMPLPAPPEKEGE